MLKTLTLSDCKAITESVEQAKAINGCAITLLELENTGIGAHGQGHVWLSTLFKAPSPLFDTVQHVILKHNELGNIREKLDMFTFERLIIFDVSSNKLTESTSLYPSW